MLFQCSLLENALSDIITVNLDNQGSLLGVSLRVRNPHCAGARVDDDELEEWDTFVEVIQTAQGPTYVTDSYTYTHTRTWLLCSLLMFVSAGQIYTYMYMYMCVNTMLCIFETT